MCFILGQVFGNENLFTGLGVFVDTYPNDDKQLEVCRYYTLDKKKKKITIHLT